MTLKVADCPAVTVWLDGCAVIAGAEFTVSVAAVVARLPELLLTTTLNCAPLSAEVTGGVM